MTQPDQVYRPLQDAADRMRSAAKEGIVYLSARHSQGMAVALFGDRGRDIKQYIAKVKVRLSLVSEDRALKADDTQFDPSRIHLSHTVGHFSIDPGDFQTHGSQLSPSLTKPSGYLDFFRIHYRGVYPRSAVASR